MSSMQGRTAVRASPVSAALKFERGVRADLHHRRWVRFHVFLIGLVTFGVLWGASHTLMVAGIESMALRHGLALVGAYAVYLGLLWVWCRWLLSRDEGSLDFGDVGFDLPSSSGGGGPADVAVFRPGGGGDFGGGGASGSFGPPDGVVSDTLSAAADAVGGADEGVVVLVPLALVIGVAVALASALGFAVFGLFGVEVLLGVAVEIAFASAGGAIALKAQREGWLNHAVRRTVGPMAIVLAATVITGLAIAHWLPDAKTLPQALQQVF